MKRIMNNKIKSHNKIFLISILLFMAVFFIVDAEDFVSPSQNPPLGNINPFDTSATDNIPVCAEEELLSFGSGSFRCAPDTKTQTEKDFFIEAINNPEVQGQIAQPDATIFLCTSTHYFRGIKSTRNGLYAVCSPVPEQDSISTVNSCPDNEILIGLERSTELGARAPMCVDAWKFVQDTNDLASQNLEEDNPYLLSSLSLSEDCDDGGILLKTQTEDGWGCMDRSHFLLENTPERNIVETSSIILTRLEISVTEPILSADNTTASFTLTSNLVGTLSLSGEGCTTDTEDIVVGENIISLNNLISGESYTCIATVATPARQTISDVVNFSVYPDFVFGSNEDFRLYLLARFAGDYTGVCGYLHVNPSVIAAAHTYFGISGGAVIPSYDRTHHIGRNPDIFSDEYSKYFVTGSETPVCISGREKFTIFSYRFSGSSGIREYYDAHCINQDEIRSFGDRGPYRSAATVQHYATFAIPSGCVAL